MRAERDISLDIPIDQHTPFGISANRVIFDVQGYNTGALSTLQTALNVGINSIMLDMYWNEYTGRWQLCPAPIPEDATTNRSETVNVSWKGKQYKCQPGFSDMDVYVALRDYLRLSNIESRANVVQMILNLKLIHNDTVVVPRNTTNSTVSDLEDSVSTGTTLQLPQYMEIGNASLSSLLSVLGSFIFTPAELGMTSPLNNTITYDDDFPTQKDFLYSLYKRTFATAITPEFVNTTKSYNITALDANLIYFYDLFNFTLEETSEGVLDACLRRRNGEYNTNFYTDRVLLSKFRTLIDHDGSAFTPEKAHKALQCGYMPILNATKYPINNRTNLTGEYPGRVINDYIPYACWSWAPFEPDSTFTNDTRAALEALDLQPRADGDDNEDLNQLGADDDPEWQETALSQVAEKCVVMKHTGWAVENCYNKYRLACKHTRNPFDWKLSDEIALYFSTNTPECPKNYKFGIPHLSTEQLALQNFLNASQVPRPVWIDMNDITILGCFVDGGPYAECPYKRAVSTGNLIRLVAPSAVVAVVILILIFFERFFLLTPVHTNRRRHWKRTINQHYKKNDYEGVPS